MPLAHPWHGKWGLGSAEVPGREPGGAEGRGLLRQGAARPVSNHIAIALFQSGDSGLENLLHAIAGGGAWF